MPYNPLRKLGLSLEHPAQDSVPNAELSSILEGSHEAWVERRTEILKSLQETYPPSTPKDDTIKVLRSFAEKLPARGQLILMSEIVLFKDEAHKLRRLRKFLVDAILKPMVIGGSGNPKTPGGTPTGFDADRLGYLEPTILEAAIRDDVVSSKVSALRREGYRCAVSGDIDYDSRDLIAASPRAGTVRTHCVHILPLALKPYDVSYPQEAEDKAVIWWALHRYFPDLKDLIGPERVSEPDNAITMMCSLAEEFGTCNLALEPLGNNGYRVRWLRTQSRMPRYQIPEVINLVSRDPAVPLPNAKYLEVHLQVAEILEMSGIGKKIDKVMVKRAADPTHTEDGGLPNMGSILTRKMLTGV